MTTRGLVLLPLLLLWTACSTAHDDFREQAEGVVRGFLEAVVAGDAEAASSHALIEGDSKYFVIFTDLLAAGEVVVHEARLLYFAQIRPDAGPHGLDALTAHVEARVERGGAELPRRRFTLELVGSEREWYIKHVPDDWSDLSR